MPPTVAALGEARQRPARAHQHLGQLEGRPEPRHRRAGCAVEGVQPCQTGQRGDVEPLAHDRQLALGEEQLGHTHRTGPGGRHGAERTTDGRVQVAAVSGAAGLPGHDIAVEPRELQPGRAGFGSLTHRHRRRVYEGGVPTFRSSGVAATDGRGAACVRERRLCGAVLAVSFPAEGAQVTCRPRQRRKPQAGPAAFGVVVETGVDPVTPRFSGVCSAD